MATAALLLAVGILLTCAPARQSAHAMPPADGLTGAKARAAERLLDAAVDRGVGELPASPFLKVTACGVTDRALQRAGRAHRTALVTLRRAQRVRGNVRGAQRRVRVARVAMKRAAVRRLRACKPSTPASVTDPDGTTLDGTTVAERPRATVRGRSMSIALPVEFSDVRANRSLHAPARYEAMLFGDAYPHGGGSLARYFSDMSYGALTVDGDVAPWRRVAKRRAAYAADAGGMGEFPANSQSLLADAVRANDASIDFGRYDNDGPDGRANSGDDDGFVDSAFVIYAGTSAAENGNFDAIWPHAWRHVVPTGDRSANGGVIRVGRYAAVPERMAQAGPDGNLLTVGIAAHEFAHMLGLPDLVDGDDGHAGPGQWDLMGTGMYGVQHSSRPSGLSAWSRARLGWVTPQLLQGDHVGHALGSSYAQRSIAKLPIAGTPLHEHFLVERRERTGFDADLPGDGLLVWHVDDSVEPGGPGPDGHPRVELVAADGAGNGDVGDLLTPGASLSDSSSPATTRAHDGDASLVAIQNVQPGTVDLHAGRASLAPIIDAAIDAAGPQAAAPTASLTAPTANQRVRGTITMSCTGTGSPNVNRIYFYRDSTTNLANVAVTPTAATATRTYDFNTATRPNGPNTLACRARNTSNQFSAYSSVNVVIDNAAPATPSISAPAAAPTWLRGTVAWTATGTDNYGVTNFSYRVDGIDNWQAPWTEVTPSTNTYSWDTTTVTNGSHTLTVRSEDLAGNQSAVSTARTVNVDNALPTMAAPTDGATLPDVDAQASTTTLDARWVAATDAHSGVAGYAWRFCTTPACGTIVASGSGAGLTAAAGALALTDGTYHACVRPLDVAGNEGIEQCSDGVLVDGTAPTMSTPLDGVTAPDLDSQLSTTTLDANWTAANDGGGTGVANYAWRFCTTPACGTVLASGSGPGTSASATGLSLVVGSTYYACVSATDQLGQSSADTCSNGITIDGPPTVTITNPANGSGVTGTVGVQATATDTAGVDRVEFWLDGALQFTQDPGPLTTPLASTWTWNTSGAATGSHTIEARAYDGGGLMDTHTITVLVDRTNPTTSHAGITSGSTVSGTITLTSTANDAGGVDRVEYRIDNITRATAFAGGVTNFTDPGTPFNTAALPDGNHAYRVQTFDLAGNAAFSPGATPFIVNNNYETVAPTGTVTSPAGGTVTTDQVLSANVQDTGGAIVSVEWLMDGSPIAGLLVLRPIGGTTSMTANDTLPIGAIPTGTHVIAARVTDASGNQFVTPGVTITK